MSNAFPSPTTPTGTERKQAWNITQLAVALREDLTSCQSELERGNCTGIYTREMRELRDSIKAEGRKFTPGECAVMDQFGIAY